MRRGLTAAGAAAVLTAALLSGCASGQSAQTAAEGSASQHTETVTLGDGWAKSAETDGMTGLFGVLENHGEQDLVIAEVTSDAAGMVELHEVTADGVMREIAGEVVIPAGGSLELVPGGNHIMLMALTRDLKPGEEVSVRLRFDDGSESAFTVLVKDYSGANEEYDGGHGDAEHSAH